MNFILDCSQNVQKESDKQDIDRYETVTRKTTTGCFLMSWGRCGVGGVLACRHGDGLRDKLVAQGSGRLRVQVFGHDRDLAEVASSQCVFVLDPADKRRLVRLNTHTQEVDSVCVTAGGQILPAAFLLLDQTNTKKTKQSARVTRMGSSHGSRYTFSQEMCTIFQLLEVNDVSFGRVIFKF